MNSKLYLPKIQIASDASGAALAAERGDVVVIVDVIDMSTTLETCIELGAVEVFGASPQNNRAPVKLDPAKIASVAAKKATKTNSSIIIVSEPRFGRIEARESYCSHIIEVLKKEDCIIHSVVPNVGKEIKHLVDCKDKIIIAVTSCGGTAYDAAFCKGAQVCTATVARTNKCKGNELALKGCMRALKLARSNHKNITIVASSSNSLEDVLAVEYLSNLLLELRFLEV